MPRIAYLDCYSGCAGDMCLGALVDAGCDQGRLAAGLVGLGLGRAFDLRFERTARGALAAVKAVVEVFPERRPGALTDAAADAGHPHRRLADVLEIIGRGGLPARAAARAEAAFRALAAAEARVHGSTPEEVAFHEVGAIDAIVDIVGTCLGLEILDVETVYASEATVGRGTIRSAHGELPAPGPAVLHLLEGRPIRSRECGHELTTPTGAALLATLAGPRMGPIPAMTLRAVGVGAGEADFPTHPNVLRVLIGEVAASAGASGASAETPTRCVVIEANLDDCTPQVVAAAIDALLTAGALDAFAVPCVMKKGRPGHILAALSREDDVARLEAVFFRETPTFGVRRRPAERTVLAREIVQVATEWGPVDVKVGRLDPQASLGAGGAITATPEFESARRLAAEKNVPLRNVLDAARAAARSLVP